jgi:hypothetical protein
VTSLFTPRVAFLASLGIWWLNVLLTTRWADVPGSIHGAKRPLFIASLVVLTVLAVRQRAWTPLPTSRIFRWACAAGVVLLTVAFFSWFPPSTWRQIPFLDNWVPRYQSTIDQIALFRRGAFAGWNWWFLGGYQLTSDLTQNLGVLAFPFVLSLGPQIGFHALHVVLFASVPVLVYVDIKDSDSREAATLAAAIACVLTTGYCFSAVRSGDTNSLAGVGTATLAVVAMHRIHRGRRFAAPLLAVALVLTAFTHLGFFAYAIAYGVLHAIYYRDPRAGILLAAAVACAVIGTLPAMWENWTLPSYFSFNNVLLHPPESFQWGAFVRQFYYNVEILFRPGRWFNDYTTPIRIFLPITIVLAFGRRDRIGFHAWGALTTLGLMALNYSEFGFAFSRPFHMLPVFTAPVLAGFLVRYGGSRKLVVATLACLSVYVSIVFSRVPHVNGLEDWNAALVAEINDSTAGMVLVENSPHLDMIESPDRSTPKTPFGVHFEPLLPVSTGRRFYAGFWDGWQWSRFREHLLAAGAMWGRPLAEISEAEVVTELRRWGIQDVFVWSPAGREFFGRSPHFSKTWVSDNWEHLVLKAADTRSVVTETGSGSLADLDPLGGRVLLRDVMVGTQVVVRTNYYPVWSARAGAMSVALVDVNGQLAFQAPQSGSYEVLLEYPRRTGLMISAGIALGLGLTAMYVAQAWLRRDLHAGGQQQ